MILYQITDYNSTIGYDLTILIRQLLAFIVLAPSKVLKMLILGIK